jgi:hypothetical protein
MTTKTKTITTPEQLADAVIKLSKKQDSFTINAFDGKPAKPGYWAVGGMVRHYGELNSLYYSPAGAIDRDALINNLRQNWQMVMTIGHLGVWRDHDGIGGHDLFVDSTYLVPCACDTEAGFSHASFEFALRLGRSNNQEAICHVCDSLATPECTPAK